MNVLEWAESVKADLVNLQQQHGIPALWAAAQMVHESAVDGGDALSSLALNANNFAGLKWADWERQFGCSPVRMGTWEVMDGRRVDLTDAFCSCPSWEAWLQVYASLLTSRTYQRAAAYANDPLLYGLKVWESGWATDPAYISGVGGWMARLYDRYADTLPGAGKPAYKPVRIQDQDGRELCDGWLQEDRTVVRIRPLVEALGISLSYANEVCTLKLPPGLK